MSGERDEFNFVSIIPTWLLEGIPSVFPECVNENIEESVFSNWQLLSSWGVFLPIQTFISPFQEATFVQKRKSYFHTDNPTLRRARLGISQIFCTSNSKFWTNCQVCAIFCSNTNSLQLFCENSSLNSANFTRRVITFVPLDKFHVWSHCLC